MAQIQWSTEYETGNPEVDGQHRKLVDIVNRFEAAFAVGKGRRVMQEILAELIDYTREHFTAEEAIMREAGYDNLELHTAQHRQLLKKVQRFQVEYHQGKRLSRDVDSFLNYWLLNHIQVDDMAFARRQETGDAVPG